MSSAADRQTGGDAQLLDVSDLPLRMILGEETALAGALDRLARETHSSEGLYAGFANFAGDDEPEPAATGALVATDGNDQAAEMFLV